MVTGLDIAERSRLFYSLARIQFHKLYKSLKFKGGVSFLEKDYQLNLIRTVIEIRREWFTLNTRPWILDNSVCSVIATNQKMFYCS